MNVVNSIKQHLNNKTVVHLSMLAFAVTSTLNIAGFFRATDHNALVAASIGLALGGGLMCNALAIPRHEWQDPIILLLPVPVLATLAIWVGRDCEPITVSAMRRVFGERTAHRRRLSAVRADVRRRVKQYSVEVA